jgi:hypothetical protein
VERALIECLRSHPGVTIQESTTNKEFTRTIKIPIHEDYKAGKKITGIGGLIQAIKVLELVDVVLIGRLNEFKKRRNNLMHSALAACIDPDGEIDFGEAKKLLLEITELRTEARNLQLIIGMIENELSSFGVFEDIANNKIPLKGG